MSRWGDHDLSWPDRLLRLDWILNWLCCCWLLGGCGDGLKGGLRG